MDDQQRDMFSEYIESHRRMIAYHRKQIVELTRKMAKEPEICTECFDFEIINENR